MVSHRKKISPLALGGAATLAAVAFTSPVHAYNNDTHFKITDLAWQVMRLASDRNFRQHVPWTTPPNDATFSYPDEVGDCTQPPLECGTQPVSQQQWSDFIKKVGASLRRLNRLRHEVPDASLQSCRSDSPGTFMSEFSWPVTSAYRPEIFAPLTSSITTLREPASCDFQAPERHGIYTNQFESKFNGTITIPDDGKRLQGLAFGYHAQEPDNEWADTVFMTTPVIGQALAAADSAARLPLKAVLAALICGFEFISNGNTDTCKERVDRILDKIDPVNFLRSLLSGPDLSPSGAYVGIWHHINVRSHLVHTYYDDQPGLYYQEAGPEGEPGIIDQAIDIGGEVMALTLDADKSLGPSQYQISTSEDGQQATDFRKNHLSTDAWTSQLVGDTIFEPVDNLGQYGWALFQASAAQGTWGASGLSWPLHAIGDATEPHHIVATTSWGHRPYEEWVQHNWDTIAYEMCNEPGVAMFPLDCNDDFFKKQIEQARRILQWGLYWTAFTANTTGVRSYISQVAQKTLDLVSDDKSAWPFCDGCSFTWQMSNSDLLTQAGVEAAAIADGAPSLGDGDPESFYDNDSSKIQNLVEMATGATLAFLMKASEGRCDDIGATCSSGAACCTQNCDPNNKECCRDRGDHCWDSGECCAGRECGSQGVCCEKASGSACTQDQDCCQGKCNAGTCCKADLGQACAADSECCGGSCINGVCCQQTKGSACGGDAQCCGSLKCSAQNQCCNVGASQACGTGDVCCRGQCTGGKCCVGSGATCATDGECCAGSSCTNGQCCGGVGAACGLSTDCCSRVCKNNACTQCTALDAACTTDGECCLGTCQGGLCKDCTANGQSCTDSTECCSGTCSNGTCVLIH